MAFKDHRVSVMRQPGENGLLFSQVKKINGRSHEVGYLLGTKESCVRRVISFIAIVLSSKLNF